MARVDKTPKKINNEPRVRQARSNVIVREEHPKGEKFFRIILWIMLTAFLATIAWIVIDTIIKSNQSDEPPFFEKSMYVNQTDIRALTASDGDGATVSNPHLGNYWSNSSDIDIYIYFFDENLEEKADNVEVFKRQEAISTLIKDNWSKAHEDEITNADGKREKNGNFWFGEEGNKFAIFFFDISNPMNHGYTDIDPGIFMNSRARSPFALNVNLSEVLAIDHVIASNDTLSTFTNIFNTL